MSNDIDLELVQRLHPDDGTGRRAARQRARANLLNEFNAAGSTSSQRPRQRRRHLRLMAFGSTATAVAAAISAVLLLTATSATSPAYALTRHVDGTLTLTLYRLTNDIPALNAQLAQMGIDETVVPVTAQCQNQFPIYPVAADTTITLYTGRKYLSPGFQGVLAAEQLPNGKIALAQGALKPADIPPCFATVAHTHITVIPQP